MDLEQLIRCAAQGDVKAFVALTRRFQHFAFGSALALVGDFHQAEDVVQEAFVAAWAALPSLTEPAAFPGWLRSIVRHHASRVLRRAHLELLPLAAAEQVASDQLPADDTLDRRHQTEAALAAIAELPPALREAATLFFVQRLLAPGHRHLSRHFRDDREQPPACGPHQTERKDVDHGDEHPSRASPARRLRQPHRPAARNPQPGGRGTVRSAIPARSAERTRGQRRSKQARRHRAGDAAAGRRHRSRRHRLADRCRAARGDGAEFPAPRRNADRPGDVRTRRDPARGPPTEAGVPGKLLETGIKVIDVMCALVAVGTVAIAGEFGAGTTVVMEELVRRLGAGKEGVSLFTLMQWPGEREPGFSLADELKKEGFSEGTVGAVQTFFFRAEDGPWTADRLAGLAPADVVIHLSRRVAAAKIYPCVDLRSSRSRLLEGKAIGR